MSQYLGTKPVWNSFLYYLTKIINQNQVEALINLRDIITFKNPYLPYSSQIDHKKWQNKQSNNS